MLGLFLGKNVILERTLVFDLPCAGDLESLLGPGLCLQFWHCISIISALLLGGLRHHEHAHPFSFQLRHGLYLPKFLQRLGKPQQQDFTPFLVNDRPAKERHRCLYLRAFFQKVLGVLNLEIKVVILSVRPKAYLLDNNFLGLRLDLFLLLLLLVFKLGVINYLANRRIGVRRDLNQVKALLLRQPDGLLDRVHIDLYIFTYDPHPRRGDALVDLVRFFGPLRASPKGSVKTAWSSASVINTPKFEFVKKNRVQISS